MNPTIPHLRVVVGFCIAATLIYAGFSVYVVAYLKDAALTGDVIGTWKSFAVAVMAFWVGSSSGGKQAPPTVVPPADAIEAAQDTADAAQVKADAIKGDAP